MKSRFSFTPRRVGGGHLKFTIKSILLLFAVFASWISISSHSVKSIQSTVRGLTESTDPKNRSSYSEGKPSYIHEIIRQTTDKNLPPSGTVTRLPKNISIASTAKTKVVVTSETVAVSQDTAVRTNATQESSVHNVRLRKNNRKNGASAGEILYINARSFDQWPADKPLPCYEAEENWVSMDIQRTKATTGFLYLKPYKTGSSTGSGINLRIARNVAKRHGYEMCRLRFEHGPNAWPGYTLFHNRSHENSILWTVIREPTARAISSFFHFGVSRSRIEPTNENFIQFVSNITLDYYLDALYTETKFQGRDHQDPIKVSNSIINEFNFIGITERMDESAVALMMLLNLKIADILYLSAKKNGGYDDGGGKNGCTIIKPSFVSPEMQDFFNSYYWKNRMKYELALYEAANRSLDMTIDSLGRAKFEETLAAFKRAKAVAYDSCAEETKFPCDQWGRKRHRNETDCLWNDSGCGTTCLDQVATDLKLF